MFWDTLITIGLTILGYGGAILFALAVGWTLAKILRSGPVYLKLIVALLLFSVLVIGPIIGIIQGVKEGSPIYYDEAPYSEFDRYN